ncbi:MAG TPA: hypothetical protein VJ323_02960 [Bryobacteraceae bacterium]|nr:hypothetical protein [Bryobacteraceae bacterium]
MVIVVPAFTHGEECEQPVVARIVAGDIAYAPTHMRKRIDAKRGVIDQYGTPEETNHQAGPSASNKTEDSQSQRWPLFELVQESQFWITREIRHFRQISTIVSASKDPSDMAVKEAFVPWGMRVVLSVGMQMVMPVHRGPPENAFLCARLRGEGKHEL